MRRHFLWILTGLVTVAWTISAVTTPPNVDSALARQQQMVAEKPYLSSGHNDLGNLLLLAGRFAEAEEAYRKAIELDPDDPGPRFNLGVLQQQQRQLRGAAETFNDLLEIYPRHAWGNYQMGVIATERRQRANAIDFFARAFAADPSLTFPQYNPHIIDNIYATEAMLSASQYDSPPGSNVPRQYSAPERIAEWMLQSEGTTSPPDEESFDDEDGTQGQSSIQRSEGASEARPVERAGSADGATGRQLTPDDLEESDLGRSSRSQSPRYSPGTSSRIRGRSIGTSTGSGSATSRSNRGSTRQVDRQDREEANRASSALRRSTSRSRQVGSSPRPTRRSPNSGTAVGGFQSSPLSTGRLELELLPSDTIEERVANAAAQHQHPAS